MYKQKLHLLISALCCFCIFPFAGETRTTQLERSLYTFIESETLQHASYGIMVYDITADTLIISHNSRQLLLPASTQKLVTTTSALMMLGHDHLFETKLQVDGDIDGDGVLHGNIYIQGSGDPSFGSSRMNDTLSLEHIYRQWIDAVRDAGIRKVEGHIIGDERIFDREMIPPRWLWGHIGNYFGAGASGLTVHENEFTVFFDAGGAIGDPTTVSHTDPPIPAMTLVNEVTTGPAASGDQVYIFGAPYIGERRLTGTVPLNAGNFPVRGSMPDPPYFAAQQLRYGLIAAGVEVTGLATTYRRSAEDGVIPLEDRETIATWVSPDMFEIIYRTNKASVNSYAENLVKAIGVKAKDQGSRAAGLRAMEEYWEAFDLTPAMKTLHDGSGLSVSNRLTPEQLMTVMRAAANHPTFPILLQSLPLAGYSGSLTNHLRGSVSEGVLRAKSGFLNNAIAYAGYTPMQNGNLAAFVIIVNDYEGSAAIMRNQIMHLMDSITRHNGSAGN